MTRWQSHEGAARGGAYDERWRAMAAAGQSIHGEADLVWSYAPGRVLDAGCGTGRVAIELAARGVEVVGVDLDPAMLDTARTKGPGLRWVQADLARLDLDGERFDVVVAAGNVLVFVAPGTEGTVVARCGAHLAPGGRFVCGFQLRPGGYDVAGLDADAVAAGLVLEDRWATWERGPWAPGGDYAVSVYRAPA